MRIFVLILLIFIASPLPLAHAGGLLGKLTGDAPVSLAGDAPEFLDPEIAFQFSHRQLSDGRLELSWQIAPDYYLYRDRFKIESEDATIAVGAVEYPSGEMKDDPEFGNVEIYRDQISLLANVNAVDQIAASPSKQQAELRITYQGCAEDGICYPPITKPVTYSFDGDLPAGNINVTQPADRVAADGYSATKDSPIGSADLISQKLREQNLLTILSVFFGFGLLLSLTPCVFPMIPILSGIIVGQQQPLSLTKAFTLSAIYVLSMAATYAVIGVLAGLFGHNLQATFQQPLVLVAFSLVFVVLSLSMFGFFELQLPSAWQSKLDAMSRTQSGGTYSGVAIMGVLSAIIVGPCVAPPLAGALLYLSHQGSAVIGGGALFAMALGMGVPLLVIGTSAGRLLPASGPWMENIKRVFGVMLLGLAIWFLERVFAPVITMSLWAALMIVSAVYLGALESLDSLKPTWHHLKKGLAMVLLIYGAIVLVGAVSGAHDPLHPLKSLVDRRANGAYEELQFVSVKGVSEFEAALASATKNNQNVILDFYADWCIECKHLESQTFTDATVRSQLQNYLLLRTDVTANDDQDQQLLKRFDLFGPPAVLFFDTAGEENRGLRVIGFVDAEEFSARLSRLL